MSVLYAASMNENTELVKILLKTGLQREDIMMGDRDKTAYSIADNNIRQLFNETMFAKDVNDIINNIIRTN